MGGPRPGATDVNTPPDEALNTAVMLMGAEVAEMEGTLEEVWVVAEELEGSTEEDTLEEYSVSVVMRVVKTVDSDMSKYSRHFWP